MKYTKVLSQSHRLVPVTITDNRKAYRRKRKEQLERDMLHLAKKYWIWLPIRTN